MSGGVDSSVAAALMIREGYECIGCTMKLLDQSEEDIETESTTSSVNPIPPVNPHACCSLDDVEDARQVARRLGMPYYVFNFTSDFGEKVIDRFVRIYQAGGTPNPCIDCNRYMKFDRLFHRAQELGCEAVVTGHYARILFDRERGRWQLLRSKNPDKDQTYVLYSMTQEQLSHTIFPLGEYADKEEVRALAGEYGFVNSRKPDSQDICFVRSGKYADFIERRTGQKAPHGEFVDENGTVLGEHKGLIRYTIGQRKGLGLALPAPLYVRKIDTENNQVVLTPEDRLFSRRLIAEDFNWIWCPDYGVLPSMQSLDEKTTGVKRQDTPEEEPAGVKRQDTPKEEPTGVKSQDTPKEELAGVKRQDAPVGEPAGAKGQRDLRESPAAGYTIEVTAKPRYRAKEAGATATVLADGKVEILFHEPQRALTVGQAVVLYQGENVIGGGTICEVP